MGGKSFSSLLSVCDPCLLSFHHIPLSGTWWHRLDNSFVATGRLLFFAPWSHPFPILNEACLSLSGFQIPNILVAPQNLHQVIYVFRVVRGLKLDTVFRYDLRSAEQGVRSIYWASQPTEHAPFHTTQDVVGLACCQARSWVVFSSQLITIPRSFTAKLLLSQSASRSLSSQVQEFGFLPLEFHKAAGSPFIPPV